MTALPTKAEFTGAAVTKADYKAALDDLHDYLGGLLGETGLSAEARSTLGLGSAATRNAGTGPADLPTNAQVSAAITGLLEATTKTVFYQPTTPTGWTLNTSYHDRLLRVVSGAGGSTGGSWTISGLSASVSVASHAVTINEMGSHSHGSGSHSHTLLDALLYDANYVMNSETVYGTDEHPSVFHGPASLAIGYSGAIASYQGGGANHGHPGSTASISQNGAWRPAYASIVVGVKS